MTPARPRPDDERERPPSLRAEQARTLRETTRNRILEGLSRALARGFGAVSIAAIAEESNVSVPTIYRHFESRETLLRALVDHLMERVGTADIPAPKSPEEIVRRSALVYRRLGDFASTYITAFAGEDGLQRRREYWRDYIATFEQALEGATGDLDPASRVRLRNVVAILASIPTMEFLVDVLELPPDEATTTLDWAVDAVIAAAVAQDAGADASSGRRRSAQ